MSVLMQDFEDYEVVVYNNASEKSATKYVRELQFLKKRKLRHYQLSCRISNEQLFQWSLKKARGEYVTFLSDDEILLPNSLMSIASTLRQIKKTEILTYKKTSGFLKENVKNLNNTINLTNYSREMFCYKFDSQTHLKEIYKTNEITLPTPKINNAFYKKTFLSKIKKDLNNHIAWGKTLNYELASIVLQNTKKFYFIDQAFVVNSSSNKYKDFIISQKTYESGKPQKLTTQCINYSSINWKNSLWSHQKAEALNKVGKVNKNKLTIPLKVYYNSIFNEITKLFKLKNKTLQRLEERLVLEMAEHFSIPQIDNILKNNYFDNINDISVKCKEEVDNPQIIWKRVIKKTSDFDACMADKKDSHFKHFLHFLKSMRCEISTKPIFQKLIAVFSKGDI